MYRFYFTPGDEVPFEFKSYTEVPFGQLKDRHYLVRINNCTYSIDGIPGRFKFAAPVNEFGNVEFVDENGVRLLLRDSMIMSKTVQFYRY